MMLPRNNVLLSYHLLSIDAFHFAVIKQEVDPEHREWSSSLVQELPEPPHIKEEHDDLQQRPEDAVGSPHALLAVKTEDDDGNISRESEILVITSIEHMETQAGVEDCETSQPTRDDQLLSPHRSESDTEDSDDSEKTREGQSVANTQDSHKNTYRGKAL